MINEEKYLALIAKFLSANVSDMEKSELLQWVERNKENKQFFEETTLLWKMSEEDTEMQLPIETEAPWLKLKAQLPTAKTDLGTGGKIRKISLWPWMAAASIIPIAFACYTFFFSSSHLEAPTWASITTKIGETKEVELPDGSVIVLNENSNIQYPADFKIRKVKLEGEAFFNVTKQDGKTFSIETGENRTTVLGTSFNVRAYPNEADVEVTVVTGKVALANKQDSILLLPGEKGRTDLNKPTAVQKTSSAQQNEISWKTQALTFDDNDFKSVFLALERHFHIKIVCTDSSILDYHFTGNFMQPDLDEILSAIAFSTGLEFEKKGATYSIRKK